MRASWAKHLRDQCVKAGVPFFFKGWSAPKQGAFGRDLDGDGGTWEQMPAAKGEWGVT
jgi:protein gp37